MHDLVHGLWHFEKGILFTLKEAFIRPGKMAVNYISGKRIQYYNFFYLLLLLLGTNVLVSHLFNSMYAIETPPPPKEVDTDSLDLTIAIRNYFKLLLFLLIPFFALNGWIVFRRIKFNIAEHAVVAGTILLAGAAWYFIFNLHYYFTYYSSWNLFDYTGSILLLITLLTPVQVYKQATERKYKLPGFSWRILAWYLLLFIETYIIAVIFSLITGKSSITLN